MGQGTYKSDMKRQTPCNAYAYLNKMCPYFEKICGDSNKKPIYGIQCCHEKHIFEDIPTRNKVLHAYCETTQYSECPFVKQFEQLIEQFGQIKVDSEMFAGKFDYYEVDVENEFPDLDKHYYLSMESDLATRKSLRVGSLVPFVNNSWTEVDRQQLLNNLTKYTITDTAKVMGRPEGGVRAQITYLRANGRGDEVEAAINKRYESMGKRRPHQFTPEERQQVVDMKIWGGLTQVEIADRMGVRKDIIFNLWFRLKEGKYKYNWSHNELMQVLSAMFSSKVTTAQQVIDRIDHHSPEQTLFIMQAIVRGEFEDRLHFKLGLYKDKEKALKTFHNKWSFLLEESSSDINEEKGEL